MFTYWPQSPKEWVLWFAIYAPMVMVLVFAVASATGSRHSRR